MIETAAIFTKGGVLLWYYTFNIVDGEETQRRILKHFIETYIVEENPNLDLKHQSLSVRFTTLNNISVVILVIYDFFDAIESLLSALKTEFLNSLPTEFQSTWTDYTAAQTKLLRAFNSEQFNKTFFTILDRCENLIEPPKESSDQKKPGQIKKKKIKNQKDVDWVTDRKVTKQAMDALDYSKNDVACSDKKPATDSLYKAEAEEEGFQKTVKSKPAFWNSLVTRMHRAVTNITGNQVMDEQSLTPVLTELKEKLIEKNVAAEVSDMITEAVGKSLVNTKTASFSSVKSTVSEALCESVDVLKSIYDAKKKGQGINGVGKSTNLAKVAYYLKNKGNLNVMMAACDTFRSGAIEQLKTHAENLNVELFERGYGKDPANICKLAMKHAQANDIDVVLIDTAGRMQQNEPLMRAIAKLISMNNPDLILFVGEALVGNDSVDQLRKFDKSIIDYASSEVTNPRGIDGILVTKFDTIDDKVGTVLTMAYVSGQPIIYVGTGQRYPDLEPLQYDYVVDTLLS